MANDGDSKIEISFVGQCGSGLARVAFGPAGVRDSTRSERELCYENVRSAWGLQVIAVRTSSEFSTNSYREVRLSGVMSGVMSRVMSGVMSGVANLNN